HDTEEGAHGAGAERARGGGEIGIRGFEGGDRLTDVERAGDVGDGDRHCALREWERDSERTQAGAEQSEASEGRKQADAGDGGRQHERKLDERDREGVARKAAVREQERRRRSEDENQHLREQARLQADEEGVLDDGIRELVEEPTRRSVREDRDDRQQQEHERDGSGDDEREHEGGLAHARGYFFFATGLTRGRKPAAISFACPALLSTLSTNACASLLCVLDV